VYTDRGKRGNLYSTNQCCQSQYLSPEFTNLWAMYPTKYPIARKYETFPLLLLVHTVGLCPSSLQTWDLNTGDRSRNGFTATSAQNHGHIHCPQNILPCIHNNLNDNCVSKTTFLEENDHHGRQILHVYHYFFYQFVLLFIELCSTATFEPF
jgi:hypothetical protein